MNSSMNKWSEEECEAIVARIRQNFDYDPDRGLLVCRQTGKVVNGYRRSIRNGVGRYMGFNLRIDGHRYVMCYHRAVCAWHHGRLPTMQIDHINRDSFDNRIENLREVTQSENLLNSEHPWSPCSGGLPGVLYNGGSYKVKVKQKRYFSRDPYHLFYLLTLMGRRFK